MNKHIFIVILFVLVPVLALWAQYPRIDSYKMLKNRKDIEVNTLFQCEHGYIWIGTHEGIIRFDGVDFHLFTTNDSLADNSVVSISQDTDGQLWIGHKSGAISLYNYQKFWAFNPEEGLPGKQISSFFMDENGSPWFSTFGEGVYYYAGTNRKRLYNLSTDNGLIDNNVYTIVQDSSGLFYFGTDFGISIYDSQSKTFVDEITMKDGLPDNIVKKLVIYENQLWIGMEEGGVCTMDMDTKIFSRINIWEFGSLNDFICTGSNEIWASTRRKGMVKCNYDAIGKSWYSVYSKEIGLSDNRTNTVFIDREKNIWFGTKKGLSIRRNNNIEFLDEKSNLDFTNVFSITFDLNGKIWVASQQGLKVLQRNEMGEIYQTRLFEHTKFDEATFISLYTDTHGNIWAGTYGFGVFKINAQNFSYKQFDSNNGLSNDNVIAITGDSLNLWLSTLGGGFSRYCFEQEVPCFKSFTIDNGLTSNYIYSIFIDSQSIPWVATDGGGVYKIIHDSVVKFHNPLLDSIGAIVYSIAEDSQQNMWFSIADQGLVSVNNKHSFHLRESEGLQSNSVQSIGLNTQGNLVIVSNLGIQIYYTKSNKIETLGEAEGVAFLEPNLNALYRDKQGNCWIGTSQGIVKLNANVNDSLEPKIQITNKSLFFNTLEESIHIFNYKQNHLSFQYNAFWYKTPEEHIYRYKLDGYDIDWSPETNSRMQTYSNLPPGTFKFLVEMKQSNGLWIGSNKAQFAFTIRPPFYKTAWFITSALIFLVLSIYLFIKARTRKLMKDKDLLEEEVVRRTAEIQKQKEEIEAQRDEIEAQRNHVVEQRDRIESQNNDIKASIQYASRIQRAVLPPMQNFKNLLGESFVFFKPRDIVSGDFYYLNAKNNQVIVAAADCTGHGVPGAFMSILGISLLNQIIGQAPNDFTAGYLLTELRSEVKKALRQTGKDGEAKDGMDISLCVYNRTENYLQYSGAFNPLVLVRNKELLVYKADKMPIGVFIKEADEFTSHTVDIQKGDMLYLYSDGFQDQFGGTNNRKFLPKRLKQVLLENSHLALNEQHQNLDQVFKAWIGTQIQIDDVLVMGIRI
jgi:ligand-binding sensor domain-containing protein/serine phosphatase RsbU (regulator of sigma subunit)